MKHVKVLSNEMPVKAAEETAWVQLKNIVGGLPLTTTQQGWVLGQVNAKLSN